MEAFDVVVVGGGSAGCALASRLCRTSDLSVCLLEAGPDYGPASDRRWPADLLDPHVIPLSHDWDYREYRADGSWFPEPRARVLGGCSTHNVCFALWGPPEDYDAWADYGARGWSYSDIAPLIDEIERADPPLAYHGRRGLLPTRAYADTELSAWHQRFVQAAGQLGFPRLTDLSAPAPPEGIAPGQVNVVDGARWNAAFAFLDPVRASPRLTILSETLADRLVIDDGRATALLCQRSDGPLQLHAHVFVLAGGAYGSPTLLLRSGVGPAADLAALGIPPLLDRPGVGRNLHDHPALVVTYAPSAEGCRVLEHDLAAGRSYLTQVVLRTRSAPGDGPFDLHVQSLQAPSAEAGWTFGLMACAMAPRSRGRVRLQSSAAPEPPCIESCFLTDAGDRDLAMLVAGAQLLQRLVRCPPLAALVEPAEPPASVDQLARQVRQDVGVYSHAMGTCTMGPASDPQAVVDSEGKVYGLTNAYVADASIIPTMLRANTNLTCMLIGYRIADAIRAEACGRPVGATSGGSDQSSM